ncbi:MAG TPA: hypothetical protein VFY93_00805 [Planctomycetota bacterium]|nr:hypothetical protein [Planctomycetota bacterium]
MQNRWIKSPKWDLTWLIGSVVVVPLAPLLFHLGMTPARVAMIVMLLVGGPHVFVTFTRTNMDPRFVRNHRIYTRLAFLIPFLTATFAWLATPLFLTVFFTWASLHVLQQIVYVANCYSSRQDIAPTPLERWAEYGLIFSCLYPFATVRMVEGTFMLDGTRLLVPEAILGPGLVYTAFAVFGVFLVGWLVLTVRRYLRGTLHYGKTALLTATVTATFFTPLFQNLDVAFQGINSWHCIQYLALIWYANRLRADRGEVELGFVRSISARGVPGFLRYYLSAVAGTVLIIGIVFGVAAIVPRGADGRPIVSELLIYYMIGKGLLLTHYYYDTFLFTQRDELSAAPPATTPAAAAA